VLAAQNEIKGQISVRGFVEDPHTGVNVQNVCEIHSFGQKIQLPAYQSSFVLKMKSRKSVVEEEE
jgi:hypothetical protein